MLFFKFRIIKMYPKKQVERKKQIQSKMRFIEGKNKNGRRTAELKKLKKKLTEINSIIDYSTSSNISIRSTANCSNPRGSGSSSSSSSSSVNSYFNVNDDDDVENDFQDFLNSMEDPEVANLN